MQQVSSKLCPQYSQSHRLKIANTTYFHSTSRILSEMDDREFRRAYHKGWWKSHSREWRRGARTGGLIALGGCILIKMSMNRHNQDEKRSFHGWRRCRKDSEYINNEAP